VEQGLTNAALLGANGEVHQPSEVFYKKPILIERGSFRPITWVNFDMMRGAARQFNALAGECAKTVEVFEITMNNLMASGTLDHRDFLDRAALANAMGKNVLISNYAEYYRLAEYLWRYTQERIGLVMGIPNLREIFNEKYYDKLDGGILESFGRLFKNGLKLYVYPTLEEGAGGSKVITVGDMKVEPKLRKLFEHIRDNGDVVAIEDYKKEYLGIYSRDVLEKIKTRDNAWEKMVPPEVAALIKERGYFGYGAGVGKR
jgi:hypothetical protein